MHDGLLRYHRVVRMILAIACLVASCGEPREKKQSEEKQSEREGQPPPSPPGAVAIPGRAPEPLVVYAAGSVLPTPEPSPRGMRAVALDGDDVYFLDSRVHRLLRRGSGGLEDVATWGGESGKLVLTATHAYVSGLPQAVTEIAKAGGATRAIVWGTDPVQDFAADATHVYVATAYYYGQGLNGPDGKLLAFALSDRQERVLAEKLPGPTSIDVDSTHVYFAAQNQVSRVAKTGGSVELLTELDGHYGWRLLVDGDRIYVAVQETMGAYLARLPTSGGPLERLARLQSQPASFDVGGDALYVVAESDRAEVGTLWRLDLATRELTAIATGLVGYPFMAADDERVAWLSGPDAFVLPHGERTPQRVHAE